jgi:hypothetical protein
MNKFNLNTVKYTKVESQIQDYFKNFHFEKHLNLFDDLPLRLHWSDSKILMDKVRKSVKAGEDKFQHEKISALEAIDNLKKFPVWIKNQHHIIPMTLLDVYHTMALFIKKDVMEDELYNVTEISFVGPAGPFKEMSLIDCINPDTLQIFLHWQVLNNKLPQRAFRLNTRGHVMAQLLGQNSGDNNYLLKVDQITDSGILFSSTHDGLLANIDKTTSLKFYFDSQKVTNVLSQQDKFIGDDLYYTDNKLLYFKIDQEKIIKKLKYNSHQSGEFYLFCRYHHMKESEVPESMINLTDKVKMIMQDLVA